MINQKYLQYLPFWEKLEKELIFSKKYSEWSDEYLESPEYSDGWKVGEEVLINGTVMDGEIGVICSKHFVSRFEKLRKGLVPVYLDKFECYFWFSPERLKRK